MSTKQTKTKKKAGRPLGAKGKWQVIRRKVNTPEGLRKIIATATPDGEIQIQTVKRKPRVFKSAETERRSIEGRLKGAAKKGEVRNPAGRPKGQSITEALKMFGHQECTVPGFVAKYGKGFTFFQAIALKAAHQATSSGDYHARDFIAERTEGKVVTPILVNDGSIHVTISGIQEAEHVVVESEDVTDDGTT